MEKHDIFVSYAHQDRERVQVLVSALAAEGWSVFWDRTIPAGETWRSYIGAPLAAVPVVIVCWSKDSVASDWVEQEADAAAKRKVLVPVLIDHVEPPLGLRHVHMADLVAWMAAGGGKLPDALRTGVLRKLRTSADDTASPSPPVAPPPRSPAPAPPATTGWIKWVAIAATVAAVAGGLAASQLWSPAAPRPQAGSASGYVLGEWRYRLTPDTYASDQDLARKVREIYGAQAELADWAELKRQLADRGALQGFVAALGIALQTTNFERDNYLLQNSGQSRIEGMHYLFARHGGVRPAGWSILDTIGNDELHLGRWNHIGQVLVRLPRGP
ncbi:MAG TPA: toll/interleukin-1 receptor domain-containing protein [Reyranellaceae bacterium]|nr:toll/interleukin-1 receptor domain-containing protein [Reyranellaceae bacterium]